MSANVWVYAFGEIGGADVKIGRSRKSCLLDRLEEVNGEQTTAEQYRILAGVVGNPSDEAHLKSHFADYRRLDKGKRVEYFLPVPEVVEYVNWLRSQWWVTLDGDTPMPEMPVEDASHWLPDGTRRIPPPEREEGLLVQQYADLDGPLAGTSWDWMVSDKAQIQDYFTPVELVEAAREAMGGIDLDAASHHLANRVHRIPDIFHRGRSAFDNRWYGRVWLNPPYGNNAPWFEQVVRYVEDESIEQLCMLSPMWVFQAQQARRVMELSSALLLLSPTPTFWGNRDGKTGVNHPHGIIYIGERASEFKCAFQPFGFPVGIDLEVLA